MLEFARGSYLCQVVAVSLLRVVWLTHKIPNAHSSKAPSSAWIPRVPTRRSRSGEISFTRAGDPHSPRDQSAYSQFVTDRLFFHLLHRGGEGVGLLSRKSWHPLAVDIRGHSNRGMPRPLAFMGCGGSFHYVRTPFELLQAHTSPLATLGTSDALVLDGARRYAPALVGKPPESRPP